MDKIENKTKDFDLLYQISIISKTRPCKAWRKTISLRNLAAEYMTEAGEYVVSNNHNINNEMSKKFPGAFVHDITNNRDEESFYMGKGVILSLIMLKTSIWVLFIHRLLSLI